MALGLGRPVQEGHALVGEVVQNYTIEYQYCQESPSHLGRDVGNQVLQEDQERDEVEERGRLHVRERTALGLHMGITGVAKLIGNEIKIKTVPHYSIRQLIVTIRGDNLFEDDIITHFVRNCLKANWA